MGEEASSDEDDDGLQAPTAAVPLLDGDDVNKTETHADLDEWDSEPDDGSALLHEDELTRPQGDDDDKDPEIDDGELIDLAFLDSSGGAVRVNAGLVNSDALRNTRWAPITDQFEDDSTQSFPGLTSSPGGPIQRIVKIFDNPGDLFFAFFPRSLWESIAAESNRFERQTRQVRATAVIADQRRRHAEDASVVVEDIATVKTRMRLMPAIEPWEIVRVIGLLMANVLCTHRRGIFHHWLSYSRGALPTGTFGLTMSSERFWHVLRHLHFTDNNQRSQVVDKAWKIRPVVTVLQDRFRELWELTPTLSFDEGVLPSTPRMNTTRLYMPDKPHKWGTKLFMTCDSETSYCFRYFFCTETTCCIMQHVGHSG